MYCIPRFSSHPYPLVAALPLFPFSPLFHEVTATATHSISPFSPFHLLAVEVFTFVLVSLLLFSLFWYSRFHISYFNPNGFAPLPDPTVTRQIRCAFRYPHLPTSTFQFSPRSVSAFNNGSFNQLGITPGRYCKLGFGPGTAADQMWGGRSLPRGISLLFS